MCDAIAGELLVCFRRDDPAANALMETIRNQQVSHISILESLGARLTAVGLSERKNLSFEYMRLSVPAGDEDFKTNILQFLYRHELFLALAHGLMDFQRHSHILSHSNNSFQVARNSILTIAAKSNVPGASGTGFAFDPAHTTYLGLIGVRAGGTGGQGRCVAVLDTGLDPTLSGFKIAGRRNFVDPTQPSNTTDDQSHGTAVASVIHSIAPAAELVIYKVADAQGRASEWDTLAALAAAPPSGKAIDVINLSLDFGLAAINCSACGRESMSSRSAVFESMLDQLNPTVDCVIVGAAGNFGRHELAFPARFGKTLAVLACDSAKNLAGFSNFGAIDEVGGPHTRVFVVPGGQKANAPASAPTEFVGASTNGDQHYGTSFAAAYASGLVAAVWSKPTHANKDAGQLISVLQANADTTYPGYTSDHGNGLIQDC